MLRENDPADFIVVEDIDSWKVKQTYINGEKVAENGVSFLPQKKHSIINHFHANEKKETDFFVSDNGKNIRVIEALDGQLITNEITVAGKELVKPVDQSGNMCSNVANDILKITVVNRYEDSKPAVAFIKNFGLKRGAIASTVAHDSHNIIAIGVNDDDLCRAVNLLIRNKGGLCVIDGTDELLLPLPVAGLMSDQDCTTTGNAYSKLDKKSKDLGCNLRSPFMTLSFMALLVIPSLKLSDKGLFDVSNFRFA